MSAKDAPWGLPMVKVALGKEVTCDPGRAEYHRVGLQVNNEGRLEAFSTGSQRSSRVGSLKGASGLLCLPAGGGVVKEGEMVDALLIGDLRGL